MKQPSYTLHRCSECDSLVSVPEDRPNQTACCPHCDEVLQSQGWGLDRCTMIALSILILLQ